MKLCVKRGKYHATVSAGFAYFQGQTCGRKKLALPLIKQSFGCLVHGPIIAMQSVGQGILKGRAMPEVAHDLPTGAQHLTQRATGMKATIVDGQVLVENGEHTGAPPGRLDRRKN